MQFRIREFWENAAFISCDYSGSNVNRVFLKSDAVTHNAAKADQCLDDSNLLLLQTSLPFLWARYKKVYYPHPDTVYYLQSRKFHCWNDKELCCIGGNSGR